MLLSVVVEKKLETGAAVSLDDRYFALQSTKIPSPRFAFQFAIASRRRLFEPRPTSDRQRGRVCCMWLGCVGREYVREYVLVYSIIHLLPKAKLRCSGAIPTNWSTSTVSCEADSCSPSAEMLLPRLPRQFHVVSQPLLFQQTTFGSLVPTFSNFLHFVPLLPLQILTEDSASFNATHFMQNGSDPFCMKRVAYGGSGRAIILRASDVE